MDENVAFCYGMTETRNVKPQSCHYRLLEEPSVDSTWNLPPTIGLS